MQATDTLEAPLRPTVTPSVAPWATRAKPTYHPGLDGIRGLAVVAVIVYHLNPAWLPGGFFGVDVFFVLSGYLITGLLLAEWDRRHDLSLRSFWGRRARRLLPAVFVLIVVVVLLARLFAPGSLHQLRWDVPAALGYVINWRLIFHHVSYFSSIGRPPLLLNLWSLAVEEQFYLIWPPVLLFILRRGWRRRLPAIALAGAVASSIAMAVIFQPHTDPSRVYFGTDTHAQGLLIGCALAACMPPWRLNPVVTPRAGRILDRSGMAALAVIAVCCVVFGQYSTMTYRGGFELVDVAAAIVILVSVHPAALLGKALGKQPLRWLGTRSYSLYLWHWPILDLTRPGQDIALTGWAALVVRLGIVVVAAELSYRCVEQPFRRGSAQRAIRALLADRRRAMPYLAASTAGMVGLAGMLVFAQKPRPTGVLASGETAAARIALGPLTRAGHSPTSGRPPGIIGGRRLGPLQTSPTSAASSTSSPAAPGTGKTPTAASPSAPAAAQPGALAADEPILALGDSVLLAASPCLESTFGGAITVDAKVGRQVYTGLARLAAYKASGKLATYHTVLIDLGTNGPFTQALFAELEQITAGVPRVVVFNVYANRPWTVVSNSTLDKEVPAVPNMTLVDWTQAATTPGALSPDGIHPSVAGCSLYASLFTHALTGATPG